MDSMRKYKDFIFIIIVASVLSGLLASNDVTVSVFGNGDGSKDVFPVAFTDYDGDRRTDLVVLTKNFSSFRIYFGSGNQPSLQYQPGFQCDISLYHNRQNYPVQINGLNVADFTGDGVNDILVTFTSQDSYPNASIISIFKGGQGGLRCQPLVLNSSTLNPDKTRLLLKREPLIVDVNGDMVADLVGEDFYSGTRKLWIFHKDSSPPLEAIFKCSNSCYPITTGGFVDIDGDFSPDLVLVTEGKSTNPKNPTLIHYVEVYDTERIGHTGEFKFRKRIEITQPIGQVGNVLFLDVNLTGKEHGILLPYCHDIKCQKSGFALVEVSTGKFYNLNVSFSDEFGNVWTFIHRSKHHAYIQSISVRAGDFNLNGYPDLVATLMMTKVSASQAETRSVLFENIQCSSSSTCAYPRAFKPKFELLESYTNVLSTAFYDSSENGLLDIMGVRVTSTELVGPNATYEIFVKENSPGYDAYFVRWTVTTGVCERDCPAYSAMVPGGTMKYSTIDLNSQIRSSRASQVFRRSFALDLPGNLMGIGPTPNFIDTITFGGISTTMTYTRTQIIPNSNLIAIAKRDGANIKWEMKQLLRPNGKGIMATFHVLLFICVLNAAIVFFLHMKERKMDRIERNKDPLSMSALTMT